MLIDLEVDELGYIINALSDTGDFSGDRKFFDIANKIIQQMEWE